MKDMKKTYKITWITYLALDVDLHKTSRIEILKNLAKKGHDVELIATRSYYYNNIHNEIKITTIPIRQYPIISPLFFGLILFFYLPYYLIRYRPDYIITEPATFNLAFLYKLIMKYFYNFKTVLDIRSIIVYPTFITNFIFKISLYMAPKIFDGITIISEDMKEDIVSKFYVNPGDIGVWSDAADSKLFSPEIKSKYESKIREKFGLENRFIVLYHGDMTIQRGILECVKAISLLKGDYPTITLFLLGGGKALPEIKRIIKDNQIEENVILYGPVLYEEVSKYISIADVGIIPLPNLYIWRNQRPLKLMEYSAMGIPAIVTDIRAHREVLKEQDVAFFMKKSDSKEISETIIKAYNKKDKLNKMGLLARNIILNEYNWEKSSEDFERYLVKLNKK